MPKKPNGQKHSDSPELRHPTLRTSHSSPKKMPLPPLARRSNKVNWMEIMRKRQPSIDKIESDSTNFYYDKAFDSPDKANYQRFYSQISGEDTRSGAPSPEKLKSRSNTKLLGKMNKSFDIADSSRSNSRLAFSVSLLDRIDEEERKLMSDGDQGETLDKLKKEQKIWTDLYNDLDNLSNPLERAVAARRVAHNSQKLLDRVLSLHDQHYKHCTKHINALNETIGTLKREVLMALKLKEALVVKSLDQERIQKEIEDMFENGDEFNYENFTISARRLLDREESQLTYHLIEAYTELAKDRQFPSTEIPELKLGSLPKWEQEMRMKFL